MLGKNKTPIWAALLALSLVAGPAMADEIADFPGRERLKAAIWRLAGFLPEGEGLTRSLALPGPEAQATAAISLVFGEALNPWPEKITISTGSITVADSRPFGGPHLRLNGKPAENAPEIFIDLAETLVRRLMDRPRLESFTWEAGADGFDWARTKITYGARFGPGDLYLARFDPARHLFKPYHESEFTGPANLSGWEERLPAARALINAGQF
jgi:hypothetical protein